MRAARIWHTGTALVAAFALVVQLILVIAGSTVLVENQPPGLAERLFHLVGYFTIQSNLLVLLGAAALALRSDRDGRWWRVVRLDSLVGITVTGLVHWFLLRPLIDLSGWSYAIDLLLHVVVPALAVVGWLLFGPWPRVDRRTFGLAWIWPAAWLVGALVIGLSTDWYPYPFLNIGVAGAPAVVAAVVGVGVLFGALAGSIWLIDRRRGR